MAKAARTLEDFVFTGHGCDKEKIVVGNLQSTVFINGVEAAVKGDLIKPHRILSGDECVRHNAYINRGSTTVFIEGIQAARLGDSADLGNVSSGSPNVYIGTDLDETYAEDGYLSGENDYVEPEPYIELATYARGDYVEGDDYVEEKPPIPNVKFTIGDYVQNDYVEERPREWP